MNLLNFIDYKFVTVKIYQSKSYKNIFEIYQRIDLETIAVLLTLQIT